jgi:hypothetical protein
LRALQEEFPRSAACVNDRLVRFSILRRLAESCLPTTFPSQSTCMTSSIETISRCSFKDCRHLLPVGFESGFRISNEFPFLAKLRLHIVDFFNRFLFPHQFAQSPASVSLIARSFRVFDCRRICVFRTFIMSLIYIPSSIERIAERSFAACTHLVELTFAAGSFQMVPFNQFAFLHSLKPF